MVVDPQVLIDEMDYLTGSQGIDVGPEKLKISELAHLIMPYHKMIDVAREHLMGAQKIGTTGRVSVPVMKTRFPGEAFVLLN